MCDDKNVNRFKLVILGDTGVGKTSLAVRFVRDIFRTFETTTGGTFLAQKIELEDSTVVKFHIWDTAGHDKFRSVAPLYYRGASAAIVVYDITNPFSLVGAKSWIAELLERGDPGVVIALAGNKVDLDGSCVEEEECFSRNTTATTSTTLTTTSTSTSTSTTSIAFEEAESYAKDNGILHLGTSAKDATNVKALFVEIARQLPTEPPLPPYVDGDEEATTTTIESSSLIASPEHGDRTTTTTTAQRIASSLAALCCPLPKQPQSQSLLSSSEEQEEALLSDSSSTSVASPEDSDRTTADPRSTVLSSVLVALGCFKRNRRRG